VMGDEIVGIELAEGWEVFPNGSDVIPKVDEETRIDLVAWDVDGRGVVVSAGQLDAVFGELFRVAPRDAPAFAPEGADDEVGAIGRDECVGSAGEESATEGVGAGEAFAEGGAETGVGAERKRKFVTSENVTVEFGGGVDDDGAGVGFGFEIRMKCSGGESGSFTD